MPDRTSPDLSWHSADCAVVEAIAIRHAKLGRPVLVGLAGAQGSGKSTMAPRIAALLADRGMRCAVLALDDFYLTRPERAALARSVHPLLATRGVPGTHDLHLLAGAIEGLLAGEGATIPRFDKASDDRLGKANLKGRFDVVVLEGWCIGARPQSNTAVAMPVNALERDEDSDGVWRRWINQRLATDYAELFARLDLRVLLRAPDFAVIARWRGEQEAHLGDRAMAASALARFVAHYERTTRAMLRGEWADLVIDLDEERIPIGTHERAVR